MKLDHGAIGNGRVLALVGPDTSIDWLCLPRFDSPSIFARLLDEERGGRWAFEPLDLVSSSMSYVRNTNVLRTEIVTAQGRCELLRFCAVAADRPERRRAGRDSPADSSDRRRPADSRVLRSAPGLRPPAARHRAGCAGHRGARRTPAIVSADQRAAPVFQLRPAGAGGPPAVLRAERRPVDGLRLVRGSGERARSDHQGMARVGADHEPSVVRGRRRPPFRAVPEAARV